MVHKILNILNTTTVRHYLRVVAFVVLFASLITLGVLHFFPYIEDSLTDTAVEDSDSLHSTVVLPRSLPVRLKIPTIGVDTTFENPLGLNSDKTIQVPESFDEVGWYKGGAAPGEAGASVILGHVDSKSGPAVFYSLGQVAVGDPIYVDRADGQTATFTVTKLERYEQDNFPTELVYGTVPYAALRLITCSGTYNKSEGKYNRNLVVYAELIP